MICMCVLVQMTAMATQVGSLGSSRFLPGLYVLSSSTFHKVFIESTKVLFDIPIQFRKTSQKILKSQRIAAKNRNVLYLIKRLNVCAFPHYKKLDVSLI